MKTHHYLLVFIGFAMIGCSEKPAATTEPEPVTDYIQYVNPIIGTNGMGHTFPGACAPFGIVQLSPDTDTVPHNIDGVYQPRVYEYCAGYQHKDSTIFQPYPLQRNGTFRFGRHFGDARHGRNQVQPGHTD